MSDLFETRVANLELKDDKKKSSTAAKKPRDPTRKRKGKTPIPVL